MHAQHVAHSVNTIFRRVFVNHLNLDVTALSFGSGPRVHISHVLVCVRAMQCRAGPVAGAHACRHCSASHLDLLDGLWAGRGEKELSQARTRAASNPPPPLPDPLSLVC